MTGWDPLCVGKETIIQIRYICEISIHISHRTVLILLQRITWSKSSSRTAVGFGLWPCRRRDRRGLWKAIGYWAIDWKELFVQRRALQYRLQGTWLEGVATNQGKGSDNRWKRSANEPMTFGWPKGERALGFWEIPLVPWSDQVMMDQQLTAADSWLNRFCSRNSTLMLNGPQDCITSIFWAFFKEHASKTSSIELWFGDHSTDDRQQVFGHPGLVPSGCVAVFIFLKSCFGEKKKRRWFHQV